MSGPWPFANPVLTAAGCGGSGRDLAAYGDLGTLGGFVTRSVTLHPRPGGAEPRIVESPSGLVNAIGLQNPVVTAFLRDELPPLQELGATVVTPRDPGQRGPLVCVRSTDVGALVAALAAERIVVSSREDKLRIALHLYNVEADVDTLLDALVRNRSLLA